MTETQEIVDRMTREKPDEAWAIVLALIEAASDELVLANVAAGPLEDLLSHHGKTVIDRIEEAAPRHPKLRGCLEMVWGENRIDPQIRRRAAAAAQDS